MAKVSKNASLAAAVSVAAFLAFAGAVDFVDPFIGTGGTGHTTPAAAHPFGMLQPGPDTGLEGWEHCSGYRYSDPKIFRFTQTHLSGTGCSDFCDLAFMPFAGDAEEAKKRDYAISCAKEKESASPGFYSVTLDDGVKVEATCSKHAAIYRITYPEGSEAKLLFDPSWAHGEVLSAYMEKMRSRRVVGHVYKNCWTPHGYYFAWEVSEEPESAEIAGYVGKERIKKTVYSFGKTKTLHLKVALSRSSVEGAERNLDSEIPLWDFAGVRAKTRCEWEELLSRVKAKGDKDKLTILYTALYHLFFQPNLISDAGEEPLYSTFSCWDTYRAAGPLYTILTPEYVPGFINSMVWHRENNGFLPVWTLWGLDNQCMLGAHSVPMIADAYLKGFEGVDWTNAWEAVNSTLREDNGRKKANYEILGKYGYFPCDEVEDESVSRLLESCYDDACAARMAEGLGKTQDAEFFRARSLSWTNVFDSASGFMRAKDSKGNWREPFDPYVMSHDRKCDYTEGNAFHWNWHVMHSPELLVELMGGREKAAERLEALFNEDSSREAGTESDVTGLIGQYCQGNEPSHHAAYFFTLLGRRDLAAKHIGEITTLYGTGPEGLCGNEDCGQMSAWYVFAALGYYPFDPCGGKYIEGARQFEEISIDLNRRKDP